MPKDIADIYNKYIANTTITFETERLRVAEMEKRIKASLPWVHTSFTWRKASCVVFTMPIRGRSGLPMPTPSRQPSIWHLDM